MVQLPTGTVTFLFTDLEGSTRLWELHPQEMLGALATHDQILRTAVGNHGGIVFSEMGDGMAAVFGTASGAVEAVVEAQLGLETFPWRMTGPLRARMGLHTDEGKLRADGHYVNQPLNRCARLMAIAHGGQAVISETVEPLVRRGLPPAVDLLDLGQHRLRDLAQPMHVFQLTHPGLQRMFPPLRSLETLPGNLPVQATSFVGREGELRTLVGLAPSTRLLTLTGVGGVGKTRLVLQLAVELLSEFPDGAWLCQLAAAGDAESMVRLVEATLGVQPRPTASLHGSIVELLRPKRLLLVLDNCEHLVEPVADLVETVLASCPNVSILATSREGLAVAGERTWQVPSLEVGADLASAAFALFVERAGAAASDFEVGDDAPVIAEICRRLDGIPLAIELAAARMRSMTPVQVRDHLDERFRLLTGGRRTLERHQTLRNAVQWSFDLLDEDERAVLCRASVFSGGFSLRAAQRVSSDPDLDEYMVLDALDSLVRKSLVQPDRSGSEVRYLLLETIRQFAEEKLVERGGTEATRHRHAAHFADEAELNFVNFRSPNERLAYEWVGDEMANLRAGFQWAADGGSTDVAVRIAAHCHEIARYSLRYETQRWAAEVADAARAASHPKLPLLLTMACDSSWAAGRLEEARRYGHEAITLLDDPRFEPFVWAYLDLAMISALEGHLDDAIELARRGSEHPADAQDRFCLSHLLVWLGTARPDEARKLVDEVVAAAEATGISTPRAAALAGRAAAYGGLDLDVAISSLEQAVEIARQAGNRLYEIGWSQFLLSFQARTGPPAAALQRYSELLVGWQAGGDQLASHGVGHLVVLLARLGRFEAAATLYGAVSRGVNLQELIAELSSVLALLVKELGQDDFDHLRARGVAMTVGDAVAYTQQQIELALAALS